jgi:hypothetical protein
MNTNTSLSEKKVVLFLTIYGLLVFYLGYSHFYQSLPRILFGASVILITASLILSYFTGSGLRAFFDTIPARFLSLFHAYRIFAGLCFLYFRHQLPYHFATDAGYGDIATGFLAIAVFLFLQNRTGYLILAVVGLLDLVNAMSQGMALAITGNQEMVALVNLPMIMIPLFMVPPTVLIHIAMLNRIIRKNL